MPEKPLNDRQNAFVRHYNVSANAADAYRKAGYSPKNADVDGHKLLVNPRVQAEIARLQAKRFEKLDIKADDLIATYHKIATADPTRLTQVHIGACRYCWSRDHKYHWRTQREWTEAGATAADRKQPAPDCEGGFGYRQSIAANDACPECEGLGTPYIVFADSRQMSDQDRALFRGVKQTQHGMEYKMADQMHALDQLAKSIQLFAKCHKDQNDTMAQAFEQIWARGSKAPIRRDIPTQGNDDG